MTSKRVRFGVLAGFCGVSLLAAGCEGGKVASPPPPPASSTPAPVYTPPKEDAKTANPGRSSAGLDTSRGASAKPAGK